MVEKSLPNPADQDKTTALVDERRIEIGAMLDSELTTLTPLDRRFVINLLSQAKPNATQAYVDAGGTAKHADRAAYKIRHKPKVQAAIDEYFHKQEMGVRETVARLSQLARAEYSEYLEYDEETSLTGVNVQRLLADGKGHLIKNITWVRTGTESAEQVIEFHDSFRALVKVGEYHALFTQKQDINAAINDKGMTVEEWREESAKRREEAAVTAALFDDNDDDMASEE